MIIIYSLNKGVNRPVVFRGLQGIYIWWLCIGLVLVLLLFAVLYIAGAGLVICILFSTVCGTALFFVVYRFNGRYGEHGWMKQTAKRATPKEIVCDQLFHP